MDTIKILENFKNCYILNTFPRPGNVFIIKTSFWWESVNFFVFFSYFFTLRWLKWWRNPGRGGGGSCNRGLVGPPFQSLKKSWQLPFLQRHQTKSWQKQTPLLRFWRFQDTTPSMTILWNKWIFPFHMVKCGVWKDLETYVQEFLKDRVPWLIFVWFRIYITINSMGILS